MKKILSLIIILFMFLSLVACGTHSSTGDGNVENDYEWEQLKWPTYDNAKQIPIPKSTMADVRNCHDIRFEFYVANTTLEDYKSYIEECKAKGFTIDVIEQENRYFALNEGKYELTVQYYEGDVMYVEVVEYRCEVDIKLLHTTKASANSYDIRIEIDGGWEDDGEKGKKTVAFDSLLKEGKHTLIIENNDDDDINGRIDFVVTEDGEYFEFQISCSDSKIDIEQISGNKSTGENTNNTEQSTADDTMNENKVVTANGQFTYTANSFIERFEKAYEDVSSYNYTYQAKLDNDKLIIDETYYLYYILQDVDNNYNNIGMVSFTKTDDITLPVIDEYTEGTFCKINVLVEDVDDVPIILVGAMCGADPSLDFTSAYNIGLEVVECAGTSEGYTYNNINYVVATDDEYYYIVITPVEN